MEIKLLAVDIDETSVNNKHRVTKKTEEALKAAIERGVCVVPVTGRNLEGLPAPYRKMDLSYVIASNGAKIYDVGQSKVLSRKLISNDVACKVLKYCQNEKVMLAVQTEGKCYDESWPLMCYRLFFYHGDFKPHKRVPDLYGWTKASGKLIEKIQVFSFDQKRLKEIKQALSVFPTLELALSTSGYIEITHKKAQKGLALEHLCEHLQIPMEQVMAIGDNANDISMLSKAGIAVAMGNAKEEVKQIADFVTTSNDEDGVANAIAKYILDEG